VITNFPDPYPDELMYSVCARYINIMRYTNKIYAIRDLFGRVIMPSVEFPNRLDYLASSLPPNHKYTVDEFIDNHTPFSFYAQFLPAERAQLIRDVMRKDGRNCVINRIGFNVNRSYWPDWLRFCPECVLDDRKKFKETYWHRVHQLQGINVCPIHAVFLESSKMSTRIRQLPQTGFSAEEVVDETPAKPLTLSNHIHAIQLKVALCANWLLQWRGFPLGLPALRNRYYNLLLKQGYAYYNGYIRAKKLTITFEKYFTSDFLQSLGCAFTKNPQHSWLIRLLMGSNVERSNLSIRHILLLIFLEHTTETFFTDFEEFKPFGKGPWPCLNPAADHYRQPYVNSCRVDQGVKKHRGMAMGTFSCDCGFKYTRPGPDKIEEDRFRFSSIQSFGWVWDNALRELWEDTSLTIREIANRLGVHEFTITRRGLNLGLRYPRQTSYSISHFSAAISHRMRIVELPPRERLNTRRQKLLAAIKANPQASRTELKILASSSLDWLRKYDKEWLESQLPPLKRKTRTTKTIDWEIRDQETAEEVKNAAASLKEVPGPPVRVTKNAISNKVRIRRASFEWNLLKLPLTAQALNQFAEPFEDFLLRRVQWMTECLRDQNIIPSRHSFMRKTGTVQWVLNSTRVREAVDAALSNFQ
jgi:hypothetical protein